MCSILFLLEIGIKIDPFWSINTSSILFLSLSSFTKFNTLAYGIPLNYSGKTYPLLMSKLAPLNTEKWRGSEIGVSLSFKSTA